MYIIHASRQQDPFSILVRMLAAPRVLRASPDDISFRLCASSLLPTPAEASSATIAPDGLARRCAPAQLQKPCRAWYPSHHHPSLPALVGECTDLPIVAVSRAPDLLCLLMLVPHARAGPPAARNAGLVCSNQRGVATLTHTAA